MRLSCQALSPSASNWFASTKEFPAYIAEDVYIRGHIYKKLSHAGLSDILIRKDKQRITVDIYTARPGIVIGKSGVEVDALRKELHALTKKNVHININEIKRPELDAKLVAQSIAEQLQNRVSFRRAMKRALASAIRSGSRGSWELAKATRGAPSSIRTVACVSAPMLPAASRAWAAMRCTPSPLTTARLESPESALGTAPSMAIAV